MLRGAQSPGRSWRQVAEFAGAMYLPVGAPSVVEYPSMVVELVVNARRVFRITSSGSIQTSVRPVVGFGR